MHEMSLLFLCKTLHNMTKLSNAICMSILQCWRLRYGERQRFLCQTRTYGTLNRSDLLVFRDGDMSPTDIFCHNGEFELHLWMCLLDFLHSSHLIPFIHIITTQYWGYNGGDITTNNSCYIHERNDDALYNFCCFFLSFFSLVNFHHIMYGLDHPAMMIHPST